MYRRLASVDGNNLIFSPYSIEIALAMTLTERRASRAQMDQVLHAVAGDELDRSLNARPGIGVARGGESSGERKGDVSLAFANALWGQKGFGFEQPFLALLATDYGAGMKIVDYKTDFEGARKQINTWASDRTNAKIIDLLAPGSLDTMTRPVLTNAVYFKAPWVEKFDPLGDRPFRKFDGSTPSVPTMSGGEGGKYGEGPGWKAAELRYLGDELSMVVIVPDDLQSFEASLDGPTLASITGGLKEQLVSAQLPKFTFRTSVPLKPQLSAMGMPLAFSDGADFSAMSTTEQLLIDDVYHQAFIAVDEEGTEAAAATAVVITALSAMMGKSLVADKPFLFAIRDKATGAILFLGRVTDPAT